MKSCTWTQYLFWTSILYEKLYKIYEFIKSCTKIPDGKNLRRCTFDFVVPEFFKMQINYFVHSFFLKKMFYFISLTAILCPWKFVKPSLKTFWAVPFSAKTTYPNFTNFPESLSFTALWKQKKNDFLFNIKILKIAYFMNEHKTDWTSWLKVCS